MKRPITFTDDRAVRAALGRLSKAALADLTIDLLRRAYGSELDGPALLAELTAAAEPVLLARGDRQSPSRPPFFVRWENEQGASNNVDQLRKEFRARLYAGAEPSRSLLATCIECGQEKRGSEPEPASPYCLDCLSERLAEP